MPVLTTMTLMSIYRQRNGSFPQAFTDPQELRQRLQRGLVGAEPQVNGEALAIAEEIESLLAAHRAKSEAILAKYADNLQSRYRDATELSTCLAPMDEARRDLLLGIVHERQCLRELLTPEQWHAAFNEPTDAPA